MKAENTQRFYTDMYKKIKKLFGNEKIINKQCLMHNGIKHIQFSVAAKTPGIQYIDAAYIGLDKKLYFFVTSSDEEIKSVTISCLYQSDIQNWYNSVNAQILLKNYEVFQ